MSHGINLKDIGLDIKSLKAARRKYLQLGQEIDQVEDEKVRSNLKHTHAKLGQFFADAIGNGVWREADK